MSDLFAHAFVPALEWLQSGNKVALATVTQTWGSAPRPVGSIMAVRDDGVFVGSVSGGCVEGAVIGEAQNALADGQIRNLEFGVSNETAWDVGLACGGTIAVHVAPVTSDEQRNILDALARATETHRAAVLASDLENGAWRLFYPDAAGADDGLAAAAREAARHDQSGTIAIEDRKWFLTVANPPLDFVLIGAVHIAQPLAEMAKLAGYSVRVIDPRTQFATEARFPGVTFVTEWADEALARTPLTARSAVVALTHDPKLDDPALEAALRSPAFYIGALGSKKTHARRLERLGEAGFSPEILQRIKGPVGLDIGARSPAEIAISILAEIISTLHGK
ncbi:MAG: hypothetical protein RJB62_216 [Pseudomonadota bacterium]|jgi:xanthine dehydrogenase accessory factor